MEELISEKVNVVELLINIHADVSSIKSDIKNMEKAQKTDKEAIQKDIADVRADYQRDLTALESRFTSKLAVLQTTQNNFLAVQNNLVGDVDNLKTAEDKRDAKRYRTFVAFVLTALGGMAIAKLPDFIAFCMKVKGN